MRHRILTVAATIAIASAALAAPEADLSASLPAKSPTRHTPPAPDPDMLRQGGDTIGDAVPITLPHQSTGTTTGYNDDYEWSCSAGRPIT